MSFMSLEASVGLGGRNNPVGVAIIQCLLKNNFTQAFKVKGRSTIKVSPTLPADGECSQALIDLIKKVQTTDLGMKKPDECVDPAGTTFKAVLARTKPTAATAKELIL